MTSEGNSTLLPANVDRRPPLPAQRGFMNFQLQNFQLYEKTKVYDLSGHECIRQRSDDGKALKYYAQYAGGDARAPGGKTCYLMGPERPFRSKHTNENS